MKILSKPRKSVETTVEDIAARFIVEAQADGPDDSSIEVFKKTPRDRLNMYHHDLGMTIRNRFNLWDPSHPLTQHWHLNPECREIVNGIDYSEDHPDAVSMDIVRAIWDQLQ